MTTPREQADRLENPGNQSHIQHRAGEMSADNGGKAGEREETLPEVKRNTEDGSDTAPSAGERGEILSEEKGNTEDGSDTVPSAGEKEETLPEEEGNTEDGSDTATSAGEWEETLPEEKRNTEDGSDTASSAGEREETLSEEKRNTEDGSDTASSAGEREETLSEGKRNTEDGSDTATSAGEREETLSEEEGNTEDGSDTAPSAGDSEEILSEGKRNTEDGSDTATSAGEREETLPEEKRNTEDGSDTASSAGEREETLPEEKRNTEDGSDTAPSAGEREETLSEGKTNTEDGSDTATSAGEREETLSEEEGNTEDGSDTAPSAGDSEEILSEGKRNTEDGSDTATSAGEREETLPEEKRNTEDGSDTASSAGEREETLPEEKRNTEDGSDTAPSAGEREETLSEGKRNTEDGSDSATSAGEREETLPEEKSNTEDGSDTAPSAGEREETLPEEKSNTEDGSDTAPSAGEWEENLSEDQYEGDTETGDDGEKQKTPEDDSPPSSSKGPGLTSIDGNKSVGFFCWEKNPDVISLIDRVLPVIDSGNVILSFPDYESDWTVVEKYSPVIIICPSQIPLSSLQSFLDVCSHTHGSEEMIMVITDLEDTESERRRHSEWVSGGCPPCPLVTLTEADMDVICTSDSGDISAERRMAGKVSRMREILQTAAENSQNQLQRLMHLNKLVIGIFSREAESQYSWLVTILKLHIFRGWDPEVRPCYISNTGFQRFCDDVSKCKFGILYHSKNRGRVNVTDVTDALYDKELQDLHSRLGRKNVIVVIDDLDKSDDSQKAQILKNQPSIRREAEDLFLISNEEKKSNYQRRLMVDRENGENVEKKLQRLKDLITKRKTGMKYGPMQRSSQSGTKEKEKEKQMTTITKNITDKNKTFSFKSSVGIFSRSSENEYSWLRNLLESQDFGKIKPVYSCCISNNGFSRFCDEVSQCKFGILYHSKNRGRVNLTDVTDSLYDEELGHLSSTLGKENVVVVIDDLDDDGDAVKNTILCSQPKIKNLAQDLILVRSASPEEKKRRAKDGLKTVLH
ncbi:uncharacterized protein [Ranitomeya imitator]|uniref:uncharacterized protein n=1 Tax=Ranitomeya imitator TaxID=111125 RepID=UPI0037E78E00